MKNVILACSIFLLSSSVAIAQDKKAPVAAAAQSSLIADNMAFKSDVHDFGNVAEGPSAVYTFSFKNTGKEPIILQKVQPSCGCTTPNYTSEPVKPGGTGNIEISYATMGRPGPINKTVTVISNAGTKILTIKGNVEKAPTTSVPQNSSSIMRSNN